MEPVHHAAVLSCGLCVVRPLGWGNHEKHALVVRCLAYLKTRLYGSCQPWLLSIFSACCGVFAPSTGHPSCCRWWTLPLF